MSAVATLEPAPKARVRRWRVAGVATGIVLVLIGVALTLALSPDPTPTPSTVPAAWSRPVVDEAGLAGAAGVKITQVAVTGAGGLVDLRFQVVNPDLAAALHNPTTPPAIVDEQTGLVVHELFMGHAHSDPFKAGVTYYFVFNDPVNWVHRGGQVTVLLGNTQVEHISVR